MLVSVLCAVHSVGKLHDIGKGVQYTIQSGCQPRSQIPVLFRK
jgi:hypothetical protein